MIDLSVLRDVLKLNIGVTQRDNAQMFKLLSSIYPMKIRRFKSGQEHNGWIIPHAWVVRQATIKKDGRVLFDGSVHPMAVAGYSSPVKTTLSLEELTPHIFFRKEFPDAYAYHCMNNYRPWAKHWGFCVPYAIFRQWTPGAYEVDLQTDFLQNDMLVGEAEIKGKSSDTVVFNAHTCHTCQANDDMIGSVVVLELFKWLKRRKNRYTYRAVLAPEHIGTVFYTRDLHPAEMRRIKLGCFVEMVGSETPLSLQQSFTGQTIIDEVAEEALREIQPELRVGPFRSIVGNDETVWEAPGIEVPMISISRFPYKEYHTSEDNLNIMSDARIEESLNALKRIVEILEGDTVIQRKFKGLIALSNPKYNLYKERPDPVVQKNISESDLKLGTVQDILPRYFDGRFTIFQLAKKFGIRFETLRDYVEAFEAKGLVTLRPPRTLDHYEEATLPGISSSRRRTGRRDA